MSEARGNQKKCAKIRGQDARGHDRTEEGEVGEEQKRKVRETTRPAGDKGRADSGRVRQKVAMITVSKMRVTDVGR